jgi:hypothetical protein
MLDRPAPDNDPPIEDGVAGQGVIKDTTRTFMAEIDPSGGDIPPEGAAHSNPDLIQLAPKANGLSATLQRVPTSPQTTV